MKRQATNRDNRFAKYASEKNDYIQNRQYLFDFNNQERIFLRVKVMHRPLYKNDI